MRSKESGELSSRRPKGQNETIVAVSLCSHSSQPTVSLKQETLLVGIKT